MVDYPHEAQVLHRYLLRVPPSAQAIALYVCYRQTIPWNPDAKERKVWQLALRRPFLLGCFDAYLALVRPYSACRQPIYAMLAIAESLPEQAGDFLPREYGLFGWLGVARAAMAPPGKAIIGGLWWTLL